MTVYVKLEESEFDGYEQSKFNVSTSFRQRSLDISEPKIYSILLVLILLINTAIIIGIAINNASNKVATENKSNSYEYGLSDLSYQTLMILNDSTTDDNHMKNDYISYDFVDEKITVLEDNQTQDDYQS